jgi:serine/threonine protein kinase/tetratricopeptide (TPR) repeat protein
VPSQLVSHYRILGPLGSGGMGVVYRAEDATLHRIVALKFLSEHSSSDPKLYERLRREARTASALNHPNICTIYEVGEDAGEVFISMEYVEGRTLAEVIQQGPLPTNTVLRYSLQLSSALAHAHDRGVLHGDLKPSNIIVTPEGDAKILDFGLARRTNPEFDRRTLETLSTESKLGPGGTLPYMAPEQIEGRPPRPVTDVWSFGVVLYEMAASNRPFHGETHYQLCNAILRDSPRPLPPHLPAGLNTIVSRCLEKEPARRYQRASEVRAALEALAPTREESIPERHARRARRSRAILAGLALILLIASFLALRSYRIFRQYAAGRVPSPVLLGVLPPVSTGGSSEAAFDSGLADTLNSRLSELSIHHAFAVIPMNSTLKSRVATVDAARQQFGVNLVLILNVQRAAENVRVNYGLVDPRSHQQVRSGTITAAASDPFALQDQVFESVAAALELQLAPEEKQSLTAHGTAEPAAYDFYIQGRGYLNNYVLPENVENAITLFGRALEKDPSYAAATAGLGEAYYRKFQQTHESTWVDAAMLQCQKAAELGPNLAAAHSCLGRIFSTKGKYEEAAKQHRLEMEIEPGSDDAYAGLAGAYEQLGRLDQAEKLYKQAISARPGYWATYNWLGLFFMGHARYDQAAAMFTQVVSLAPDSFTGYYNIGAVRILQGKYADAVPLLQRSLSIRPTADAFSNLGTAHFQMRQYADSAADFEQALKLDDKNYAMWGNLGDAYYWASDKRPEAAAAYATAISLGETNLRLNPKDAQLLGYLAEYHAMHGERELARKRLQASLRLQPNSPDMLFNAGIVYQQLGEPNLALDALEKAVALGISPELLRDTPNFDALGNHPRFLGLVHGVQKK